MLSRVYRVMQIDGYYAHLLDVEAKEGELKLVARALLPEDIFEGCLLKYEFLEYEMIRE